MIKNAFPFLILLVLTMNFLDCGDGKRVIKAYPGPDLLPDKLAILDLGSPVSNFRDDFSSVRFYMDVDGESYEIGSPIIFRIKPGILTVEIEGDSIEQIKVKSWKGYSGRLKKYNEYATRYSGKRVFYPDKKVTLNFVAEPKKKYKCQLRLNTGKEDDPNFSVEFCIIEKKSKKVVSAIEKIKYN
jgi:hypothetical protein